MKTVSIYLHIWKILKMVDIAVSFMIFYCYISSKSTIKELKWVPHKFNWVHESKQSYEYKKYSSLMKQQREDGGAPLFLKGMRNIIKTSQMSRYKLWQLFP